MKFFLAVLCLLLFNNACAADSEGEEEEIQAQQQVRRLTHGEIDQVLQNAVAAQRRGENPLIKQPLVGVSQEDQEIIRISLKFINLQEQQRRTFVKEMVLRHLTEIRNQRLTILYQTYRQLDVVFTCNLADAVNQYFQRQTPENYELYINAFYEVQNLPIAHNIAKYQIGIEHCQGLLQVLQTE